MLTIFGISTPDPETILPQIGIWSSAMFEELWPAGAVVAGCIIAGLITRWIASLFWNLKSKKEEI